MDALAHHIRETFLSCGVLRSGTRALHVVSEWLSTEPHPCPPHCYLQSDFYTRFAEWACCLTAVMSKNWDEIIFILLGYISRNSSLTILVLEARVL